MTHIDGLLSGLAIQDGSPLHYRLLLDGCDPLPLNERIGQQITIRFRDLIRCQYCQRRTKKSYNNGYCFLCFRRLARCDQCIVKPETCHFHLGTCREPDWGERVCMQHHIVYLSYTSHIKVGITRAPNVPRRWYDQGALFALPIFRVATRRHSGYLEVLLKSAFHDKTQWRQMLKTSHCQVDLRAAIIDAMADGSIQHAIEQEPLFAEQMPVALYASAAPIKIDYPVSSIPDKINAVNLEKTPEFTGRLCGIKGQYLIFDTAVLNIKKHTGFHLDITFNA